jgi:hypothetical protein
MLAKLYWPRICSFSCWKSARSCVEQAVLADRLFEEVERARLPRFDGAGDGALAADHDDFGPGVDVFEPAQQLDPVQVGKHQIGDDDIGSPLFEQLLAAGPDQGGADLVALGLDDHLEPLGHGRFVVDREDAFAAFRGLGSLGGHDWGR